MTELTASTLLAAAVFAAATSITPGPNNTMLLASGVNFGWRRTLPHLFGVSAGLLIILTLGVWGVQTWLAQHPVLHDTLKWLGGGYLLHLAWGLIRSVPGGGRSVAGGTSNQLKPMTALQAALFQWVNPKVWAMVFGFFSTYVPAQSAPAQAMALCVVFALVNLPCVGLWVAVGDRLSQWLQQGRRMVWFNRSMGGLLAGSVVLAAAL